MPNTREKLEVIAHIGDHITYREGIGICYDSALAKVIEDAYMTLKNGVTVQKWIPVTERLPKNFISVLVHIPEMNPCPAVMEAYRFDDGWVTKMAAFDINCATHWMPLPEPPKG